MRRRWIERVAVLAFIAAAVIALGSGLAAVLRLL